MHDGTIVLVEDNLDDVELTKLALKQAHIANPLVVLSDGVDAVDYLTDPSSIAQDGLPAVILLDLKLPRISGIDVLRQIRTTEHMRRVPVVVLTSSDEEKDLIDSYDLGANSYVRKPVGFAEFSEAAKVLGLYWLLINRTANGGK